MKVTTPNFLTDELSLSKKVIHAKPNSQMRVRSPSSVASAMKRPMTAQGRLMHLKPNQPSRLTSVKGGGNTSLHMLQSHHIMSGTTATASHVHRPPSQELHSSNPEATRASRSRFGV